MPLYEYYCASCKTKFDALRPMDQADVAIQCKNCESVRTSRVLSVFATLSSNGERDAVQSSFGGGCCGGGSCGCSH
jgi:putative FmdB family regulatory protein